MRRGILVVKYSDYLLVTFDCLSCLPNLSVHNYTQWDWENGTALIVKRSHRN